jgi:hypothetical protein
MDPAAAATQKCPDLSGRYIIQGEDSAVIFPSSKNTVTAPAYAERDTLEQ